MPRQVRLRIRLWAALILALSAVALHSQVSAQDPPAIPVVVAPQGDNAPAQQSKPYIILVSLDGFRFDYAQRYGARNL